MPFQQPLKDGKTDYLSYRITAKPINNYNKLLLIIKIKIKLQNS